LWTREQLSKENLDWLHKLPAGPVQIPQTPGTQFVHGSPLDEDEYIVSVEESVKPLKEAEAALTFFGHTHLQGGFYLDQNGDEAISPHYSKPAESESWDLALQDDVKYLINPGSVGQPRDGDWRAAFALFDSTKRTVSFRRVPYDLKSAQERILAAKLPPRLATRLAAGR
jgi:diadenosine tetraphosphatase ApaH/serine/threonine PP2A family protein phosphatase